MENKKEMKTYRYYIMTLALSLLVAGCSEDEITKRPSANVGDEVKFGLSLPGLSTRTIYGEEDTDNKSFPIYWVNGDLVKVASPQCLSGRNSAEYEIAVEKADQNYATGMTKTGAFGVQWGETTPADFYSIYPSTEGTELTVKDNSVSAKLQVAATQYASIKDNGTSYYAQPANMGNVVMYAVTKGVSNTAEAVELNYKPFSTVIEFEINAPTGAQAGKTNNIIIQSLSLIAPEGTKIAGDFNFNFPASNDAAPSITPVNGTGSNQITLHFLDTNQYTTVLSTTNPTLKAKMCLMPISEVPSEGWTVALNTSAGTFVKNITLDNLTAGLVHKIKLPKLNYSSQEWVYSLESWITSLPDYKNIYLSEISLPGAWYAGTPLVSGLGADENEDYQTTESIADLWKAGVRAFAVETKTVTPERTGALGFYRYYENPVGVAISGTQRNGGSKSVGTNSLYPNASGTGDVSCIQSSTKKIETLIAEIANQVKKDEFAVLVLSYADGGTSGLRYVDYGAWLQLLYDAYKGLATDVKNKIFSGVVTPNTTINDVHGKLILKINIDKNIAMSGWVGNYSYSYANNLPALFSYNPFVSQMTESDFSVPCFSDLYWQEWSDSESTHRKYSQLQGDMNSTGKFMWVFSSANRTDCTGNANEKVVTLAQRQNVLTQMMNYSKKIYDASTHNVWFYFNCGGTSTTTTDGPGNAAEFAQNMNDWLLTKINGKTDASPLGIVMFNRCTDKTYSGTDVIEAIIKMNSKFYLKHAGANTDSSTGGSTGGNTGDNTGDNTGGTEEVKSLSENYNSAVWDSGTDAISWK